uniref:YHYH protein n=1 Tax=Litorilinea aerophila TaxID=1204385 RepID=A0A540VJD1_9CHLR
MSDPNVGAGPVTTDQEGTLLPDQEAATLTPAGDTASTISASSASATFDTTAGIQAVQWAENVTITLGEDTFRYQSNGLPNHDLPEKFLIPKNPANQPFSNKTLDDFNVVTTTEYLQESPIDVTLTLHPTYAETVTQTSLGTIGYILSGARLFNDYENMERSVVALDDNITFTFDETGHDHASFVDECNGHPLADGSNYHYHGVPKCITAEIDVAGEHSHMLGVLRDGFPVYGPQGEDGVPMTNADLDACSGHFGATPEFPEGIYHYHLTEDEAPYSVDCYKGVVDASTGDTGGPAGGPGQGGRPPQIDLAAAAEKLGVTEDALRAALGDPQQGPPDFAAAAQALGVSEETLLDALGILAGAPPANGQPPVGQP